MKINDSTTFVFILGFGCFKNGKQFIKNRDRVPVENTCSIFLPISAIHITANKQRPIIKLVKN